MLNDPESFPGVNPQSSGSPPGPPSSLPSPETRETRLTKRSLKAFALGLVVAILGVPAALADRNFGGGGGSLQIHSPKDFYLQLVLFLFLFGILALLTGLIVRGLRAMKSLWRALWSLWWVIPALYLALVLLLLASGFGGAVLSFVVRVGLDYSGEWEAHCTGFTFVFVVVPMVWLMVRRELRWEAERNQTGVPVPSAPDSVEDRLTQRSLKAFAFGLAGVIPGVALTLGAWLIPKSEWGWGLSLSLGLLAASVASLLVSVDWGLRVVKSRWDVLCWVIPAGLLVAVSVVLVALIVAFAH